MKTKIKYFIEILIFLQMVCGCTLPHKSGQKLQNNDPVILGIGDFEVHAHQFKKELDTEVTLPDTQSAAQKAKNLVQDYLLAGLIFDEIRQCDCLQSERVQKQLRNFEREVLLDAFKNHTTDMSIITETELKRCYARSDKQLRVIRVEIQDEKNKALVKEISEYLKAGGDDLAKYANEALLEKRVLKGGSLPETLEAAAWKLEPGEITSVTYRSKIHILYVLDIKPLKRGTYEAEKDHLKKRLMATKLAEQIDSSVVWENDIAEIKIHPGLNSENLSFLCQSLMESDTAVSPNLKLQAKNPLIARIPNGQVTVNELISKISRLPAELQFYFKNPKTRIKAVQSLLMQQLGYQAQPFGIQKRVADFQTKATLELFLDELFDYEFTGSEDQKAEQFFHFVQKELPKSKIPALYSVLQQEAFKRQFNLRQTVIEQTTAFQLEIEAALKKKNMEIYKGMARRFEDYQRANFLAEPLKKNFESACWLYPELAFSDLDLIRIDHSLLRNLDLSVLNDYSLRDILARNGSWDLTVNEFIQQWNQLPDNVKNTIVSRRLYSFPEYLKSQKDFIKYLWQSEVKATKTEGYFFVDENLLKKIDLRGEPVIVPNEDDTVIEFGDQKWTLALLRQKMAELPLWKINQFENSRQRIESLEQFVKDEWVLSKARAAGFDTLQTVRNRIVERQRWYLVQKFKARFLDFKTPLPSPKYAVLIGNTQEKLNRQFLNKIIQNSKSSAAIYFNRNELQALGVPAEPDSLLAALTPVHPITRYLSLLSFTGTLQCETWTDIPGKTISMLSDCIYFPSWPTLRNEIMDFKFLVNRADQFGSRISGYLHAPKTGKYVFWISGDDACEFWLSADANQANSYLVASVPEWTYPGEWFKYECQQSAPIQLEAGEIYFFEALHKEDAFGDNLSLAWQLPDAQSEIIPFSNFSPEFSF